MQDHQKRLKTPNPIKYKNIPPYKTIIITTNFQNSQQLDSESDNILTATSAFTDNSQNLKCYLTLMIKAQHYMIINCPQ